MNWRDLECQTINPCICNSLYRHIFLINHYCLFVCLYSHLTYALLAGGKSGSTNAAKIECAHRRACKLLTDDNQKILTFHSIHDYFALLKAFNTNTLNFHKYFKHKLSAHQPSHMHNTRHRTNSNFNTALFNHSKTQKCYLYQVISIWNSHQNCLKIALPNLHSKTN